MQILKMKKHAGQPPIQMAEAAPISAVAAKINMKLFEELALNMVPQPDPDCGRGMLMTSFSFSGRAQPKNSFAISTGSG